MKLKLSPYILKGAIIGWLFRILGVMDIIVAYALVAGDFNVFGIGFIFSAILIVKGFTSFFADWISRLFGVVDIASALFLLLSVSLFPVNIILFLVLVYKGVLSLF